MPLLTLLLVVGILTLSHLVRGESVTLHTNIGVSALAFWLIVGLGGIRFGFGSDLWGDVFMTVLYSVGGVIEGCALLGGLYDVSSPLKSAETVGQETGWMEIRPKGDQC